MFKKIAIPILFLILVVSNTSFANYLTAADLRYQSLGGTKYKIYLTVYTECSGSEQFETYNSLPIYLRSQTLNLSGTDYKFTLTRQGTYGEEIQMFCSKYVTNCNGGTTRGIRKYTFSADVDLSNIANYKPANDLIFFWQYDFRTSWLSSHQNASDASYYVEALLNTIDAPNNNSPSFGTNAIFSSCTSENQNLNLGAIDNDELKFSFINPRVSPTVDLTFNSGFSKTSPISSSTPFAIDTAGNITFVATNKDQIGITDVKIEEYKNGKLIGYVTRGIQINTYECSNAKPLISGFFGSSNYNLNICEGDTLNEKNSWFKVTDADSATQKVTLIQDLGDFGYFSPKISKNPVGSFYRPIANSDVGVHSFVISATDDGCPTTQKANATFTITVLPKPVIDLGFDKSIPCNVDTELIPAISLSTQYPFSYKWYKDSLKNVISTDSIFPTRNYAKYYVKVTDHAGCNRVDSIELFNSLKTDFSFKRRCLGDPTSLTDLSVTTLGTIESSKWELTGNGLNTTLTNLNEIYTFPKEGTYTINHSVINSGGCELSSKQTIEICTPPIPDFTVPKPCERVVFTRDISDFGAATCGPQNYKWYVDNVYYSSSFNFNAPVDLTGFHDIKMEVITYALCTLEVTKNYEFFPEPSSKLLDNQGNTLKVPFQLDCNNPIKTAQAVFVTNPNGGESFKWYKNDTLVSKNATYNIPGVGKYMNIIIDSQGCDDTISFSITYPIKANLDYIPACRNNGEVGFFDNSYVNGSNIVTRLLDFGDSTSSLIYNPTHKYNVPQDYRAILKVIDNYGCSDTASVYVINTGLIDVFGTTPNVLSKTICSKDILEARSIIPTPYGHHIDSIRWDLGGGLTQVGSLEEMDTISFVYNTFDTTTKNINFIVTYNTYKDIPCTYSNAKSIPIQLKEGFTGEIIPFRECTKDTAVFKFERTSGDSTVAFNAYRWILAPQNSINVTYNKFDPTLSKPAYIDTVTTQGRTVFASPTTLDVYVHVTDVNGCEYAKLIPANISETAVPFINLDSVCLGEISNIKVGTTNKTPSGKIAIAELFGIDYGLTNIGEGNAIRQPVTNLVGEVNYQFPVPGPNPIKVYLKKNTLIYPNGNSGRGYVKECRAVVDTSIWIRPLPEPNFEYNKVCAGMDTVRFSNQTTIKFNEPIVRYLWNFSDNVHSKLILDSTNTKDAKRFYISGTTEDHYKVKLSAFTKHCSQNIEKDIQVYDQPIANFYFDSMTVEKGEESEFDDRSVYDKNFNLKYRVWDWGDGLIDTVYEDKTTHQYNELKRYKLKYTVVTENGCTSSKEKPVDTDAYLDIPTAFSPNGDNNNETIGLIYKLTTEIVSFKIYNRWGQVVFDAKGNVAATWDGKFEGKDQEVGVYVAHIVAKGKYNKEFNIKKNITLLR